MNQNNTKKMGRPTEAPKTHVARLRLSDTEKELLDKCCKLSDMTITEVLKMGISMVYDKYSNQ